MIRHSVGNKFQARQANIVKLPVASESARQHGGGWLLLLPVTLPRMPEIPQIFHRGELLKAAVG